MEKSFEEIQAICDKHNIEQMKDYAFVSSKDMKETVKFLEIWSTENRNKTKLRNGSYSRLFYEKKKKLQAWKITQKGMFNFLNSGGAVSIESLFF